MAWSPQQEQALRAIRAWLRSPSEQVFSLAGFAGTGKTTLAREIADQVGGTVRFAAFTGKAASVLRKKGCADASTIHSLIYKVREVTEIDEAGREVRAPHFGLDPQSDLRFARLVIVDEVSMVDEQMGRDLLSFGVQVLVLGDPMQLPPVSGGEGFFTAMKPDMLLTEIHRQAADNPIIHMSMVVRDGGRLQPGTYGDSVVMAPADYPDRLDVDRVLAADQILVGTNKKRLRNNGVYRRVTGRAGTTPQIGEKLVCLKNKHERGLLNGGLWSVEGIVARQTQTTKLSVVAEDDSRQAIVTVSNAYFIGEEARLDWRTKKYSDAFTYGYALTVHKSQGSQWNDVVLFDESAAFREHRAKHLYTGLTRAAEKIVVVQ